MAILCTVAGWWLLAAPSMAAGPFKVAVALQPSLISASGGTTTATVTVTDPSNANTPVDGESISVTSTDPGEAAVSATPVGGGSGMYTAAISGASTAGQITITATDTGSGDSGQATLTQYGPATKVAVALAPPTIAANGSSHTTATATVTDAENDPVPGEPVAITSSDPVGTVTDHGDGTYTAQITSTTTAGQVTVNATDSALSAAPRTLTQVGSTTSLTTPSSTVTNDSVTLNAIVESTLSSALPAGTVTFENGRNAIIGCSSVAVQKLTSDIVSAACTTSFPASTPQLTAIFTAASGSVVAGSSGQANSLAVGKDPTSILLEAPSAPTVGTKAIYTAVILPGHEGSVAPSGSVHFLDGGAPLSACLSQPVRSAGGLVIATCTVSYATPGGHSITARYSGDANFSPSGSSSPQQVTVRTPPVTVVGTITATMEWTFFHTPAYTQVRSLMMNGAPAGAHVLLTCHGKGCPFARSTATASRVCQPTGSRRCRGRTPGQLDLLPRFRHSRLHVGTQMTVEISLTNWIGKYYMFVVRARSGPRIQIGCLAVGGTRPDVGC